jgi:hypothetical protein
VSSERPRPGPSTRAIRADARIPVGREDEADLVADLAAALAAVRAAALVAAPAAALVAASAAAPAGAGPAQTASSA